jgi:hypothetical protein
MKYPLFSAMGRNYPAYLEKHYERILIRIAELWGTPLIDDYFSSLLLDNRGGRQGFPPDAARDIVKLREFHELATFHIAERKGDAMRQLNERNIWITIDAFLRAFRAGNQELVDLFIRTGMRLPPMDGNEPLLIAALRRGHTVIAKILIDAGVDVNARDHLGLTPLLVACGKTTHGYQVIAEKLIAKRAELDVHDIFGYTPLMLAVSGGMFDIARLLIQSGASAEVISRKGETALQMLYASPKPEARALLELLAQRGKLIKRN